MRFLGIDYGTKKIGVAITDPTGRFARPLAVLPNDGRLMDKLKKIISETEAERIVIGRSLNYARQVNPLAAKAEVLARTLAETTGLAIDWVEEDLTTQEAKRIIGDDELTDARAAALILKSYGDRLA